MPRLLQSDACSVSVPGHCLVSRIAAIAIPFALAVAACASGVSSSAPSTAAPTSAPGTQATVPAAVATSSAATASVSPAGGDASPTPTASSAASPPTSPAGSTAPAVPIDESLAALLPRTVDGLPVTRSTDTEDAARTSPALGEQAAGFAAAQVSSADVSDLAVVSLVRLKPDVDAEAFYGGWRSSFDQAACAPAGGVSGQEARTIGGRSVLATSCVEGATIYHLRLQDGSVIVSVLEVGPKGYGRALIEGLAG